MDRLNSTGAVRMCSALSAIAQLLITDRLRLDAIA
jgi:hypothetical protein